MLVAEQRELLLKAAFIQMPARFPEPLETRRHHVASYHTQTNDPLPESPELGSGFGDWLQGARSRRSPRERSALWARTMRERDRALVHAAPQGTRRVIELRRVAHAGRPRRSPSRDSESAESRCRWDRGPCGPDMISSGLRVFCVRHRSLGS